jgi:hypothetical protein
MRDIHDDIVAVHPAALSSQMWAINSSGLAVGGWSPNYAGNQYGDSGYFLYDASTHGLTALDGIQIYPSLNPTLVYGGGETQCINDSEQVVGRMNVAGVYHAAIWENGSVTDLNTRYADILPGGFVLNNATAIDNRGNIVGIGSDSSHVNQAFLLWAPVPEPSTLLLAASGLIGLVALAWRKCE